MKRDRELDHLLERGRIIPPVADVVRARALARARATVANAAAALPTPSEATIVPTRGRWLRVALAASFALAVGGAGAVAALRIRTSERPAAPPPSAPRAVPATHVAAPAAEPSAPTVAPARTIEKVQRHTRPPTPQESYAAELGMLKRAQGAYAAEDFASALSLVAEHARRFPNGRLTEEREALHVRSLARSGRSNEARRAVAAFAARFPRSVLLPRLRQAVNAAE